MDDGDDCFCPADYDRETAQSSYYLLMIVLMKHMYIKVLYYIIR